MKTSNFDYDLPPESIAQEPLGARDASRLLVLRRSEKRLEHRSFRDLPELVEPGDCLVFNDTRVFPARLRGVKATGGQVEYLLLRKLSAAAQEHTGEHDKRVGVITQEWEALVKPGRISAGARAVFLPGKLEGTANRRLPGGKWNVTLLYTARNPGTAGSLLRQAGLTPLPPYIKKPLAEPERYQTIYSRVEASAAAPTAGLHFTEDILAALERRRVGLAYVSVEIGLDTFRPIHVEEVEDHFIHSERFAVGKKAAILINETKARNRKIVAVGTSTVRALETVAALKIPISAAEGFTELAIYPGYNFRMVDALVTNFHLPRTSLIALVSAFAGREAVLQGYREAIDSGYRFLSFGDAMLIL